MQSHLLALVSEPRKYRKERGRETCQLLPRESHTSSEHSGDKEKNVRYELKVTFASGNSFEVRSRTSRVEVQFPAPPEPSCPQQATCRGDIFAHVSLQSKGSINALKSLQINC